MKNPLTPEAEDGATYGPVRFRLVDVSHDNLPEGEGVTRLLRQELGYDGFKRRNPYVIVD